jgi:YD repeat-containing protein
MKKLITLSIIIFSVLIAYGQKTKKSTKSSAVPLSFEPVNQNGGAPVNFSSGAPNISIPLWTVKSGNLSFPISVSYSSNGTRVYDLPSEVGMGWQLNAYGTITREIRGQDDLEPFFVGGFMYNGHLVNKQPPQTDYYKNLVNSSMDGEPDIFYLNLPGLSLTFLCDNNGHFFTKTKSNVIIKFDDSSWRFKVTDADGTIYLFDVFEMNTYTPDCNTVITSTVPVSWRLINIISSDQKHSVKFNYLFVADETTKGTYKTEVYNRFLLVNDSTALYDKKGSYEQRVTTQSKLSEIVSENEIVDFDITEKPSNYSSCNTGSGLHNTDMILNKITVKTKTGNTVKSYQFDYNTNNHIFLKSITEQNAIGESLPPYRFEYVKPDNNISNYHQDIWGFPLYLVNYWDNYQDINYSLRQPNSANSDIGMLAEVQYPQGGYVKYEYEPNTYRFDFTAGSPDGWYEQYWKDILNLSTTPPTWNNIIGPGVRVQKIRTFQNSTVYTTEIGYNESYGGSSGRLLNCPLLTYQYDVIPNYGPDDPYYPKHIEVKSISSELPEPSYILYNKITIYEGGKQTGTDNGISGRKELFYSVNPPETFTNSGFPYDLKIVNNDLNGALLQEDVYDKTNKQMSSTINSYSVTETGVFSKAIRALNKSKFTAFYIDPHYATFSYFDQDFTNFLIGYFQIKQSEIKLNQVTNRAYATTTSADYIETATNYVYNAYDQPIEIDQTESGNQSTSDVIKKKMYYPRDFAGSAVFDTLIHRNILTPVIKEETFRNTAQISGSNTVLRFENNMILPSISQVWENNAYVSKQWFDTYDFRGNLLETHGTDGVYNSTVYGYNQTLPVANIVNARYSAVVGLTDTSAVNNLGTSDADMKTKLDQIRNGLPSAMVTTSLYRPLIGVTSVTDANGKTAHTDYDNWGRLITVRDQNNNLIKQNEYHVADNPVYTITITGSGTTNNCQLTASINGIVPERWEWFDDYCGGHTVSNGSTLTTSSPQNFHVRAVVNGHVSECQSYLGTFSISPITSDPYSTPDGNAVKIQLNPTGGTGTYTCNWTVTEWNGSERFVQNISDGGSTIEIINTSQENESFDVTYSITSCCETIINTIEFDIYISK